MESYGAYQFISGKYKYLWLLGPIFIDGDDFEPYMFHHSSDIQQNYRMENMSKKWWCVMQVFHVCNSLCNKVFFLLAAITSESECGRMSWSWTWSWMKGRSVRTATHTYTLWILSNKAQCRDCYIFSRYCSDLWAFFPFVLFGLFLRCFERS